MLDFIKDLFGFFKGAVIGNSPVAQNITSAPVVSNLIPSLDKILQKPDETPIMLRDVPKVVPVKTTNLSEYNPELIISDENWLNVSSMSEQQIQDFLVMKGSFLKDYSINDHLTSYWIAKHCGDNGLSPQVILTHIQKEQALISQKTLPTKQRRIDYALGVGATDGGDNPKWKGMDQQLLGAVLTCTKWYNYGQKNNAYPFKYITSEGTKIQIRNSASFSLYKYCPWSGAESRVVNGAKYDAPFGNALFWIIFKKWFE